VGTVESLSDRVVRLTDEPGNAGAIPEAINTIYCDRFGGEWVYEAFRLHGLHVEYLKPKSELYLDFLPILNSGGVRLLDHSRLFNQIVGLERRTHRSGRDTIDHGRGGHDDVANAVAGATVLATTKPAGWAKEKRRVFRDPPSDSSGDGSGTGWMGL
jgi:hypothetical protein